MKLDWWTLPRLYLRRDPDAGWCLAVWKLRVFFQVVASKPSCKHPEGWVSCNVCGAVSSEGPHTPA